MRRSCSGDNLASVGACREQGPAQRERGKPGIFAPGASPQGNQRGRPGVCYLHSGDPELEPGLDTDREPMTRS